MRRQVHLLIILIVIYASLAFFVSAYNLNTGTIASNESSPQYAAYPFWNMGLAVAGFVLVFYSLLGLAGIWFARQLGLPGVFDPAGNWLRWLGKPMGLGIGAGVLMIFCDRIFTSGGGWAGFTHPPFPLSLIGAATAGIGEEILFRMFVMGLWAYLLDLVLKHFKAKLAVLWAANVIAALGFAAGHLPAVMYLLGVMDPGQIPPAALAELFFLNGVLGLIAGERYMRDGLVAAVGVHFWADIVWHVIFPLI